MAQKRNGGKWGELACQVVNSLFTKGKGRYGRLFSLVVMLWISQLAVAQESMPPAAGRAKIGKITGKILDATTSQPVEFATVTLLSRRDSALITGTITNPKGDFILEEIPAGAFRMKVSFIGYRTGVKDSIFISSVNSELNLGTLKLKSASQTLQEVVITGEKELFQQSIDKRVFNVEKSIVSQGGSATDVLETVPSITVDVDGAISLRGSGGVVVLIDGKPSTLTGSSRSAILDQIPASAIESIEVITNPSAKYDAEGMSGIINIVTKKNKLQGVNGQAMVSAGTRDKYNASLNLNYRTAKFNLYTNYSYRYSTRFGRRTSDLQDSSQVSNTFSTLYQNATSRDKDKDHMFQLGLDYYLSQRSTLGWSATYRNDQEVEPETALNQRRAFQYNGGIINQIYDTLFYQNTFSREKGQNFEANLNYRLTFSKPQQELTASATYSVANGNNGSQSRNELYNADGTPSGEKLRLWTNQTDDKNYIMTLQADYTQPLLKNSKLEAGYKSIIRQLDNDFVFENYDFPSQQYRNDTLYSNHFVYKEQVHSLYGNFSSTIKNFGYQLGLRTEGTMTNSDQQTTAKVYTFNYFSFFPSVFLSYKFKNEQQWQLNYSRRISRPDMRQLNPFVNFANQFNISYGNPRLKPEYTDAYELSYLKGWKSLFLTSSAYYRYTTDVQQRFISVDTSSVTTVTFVNLGQRKSYGFEFIARLTLAKWWNVTGNFNLYRTGVEGRVAETNYANENTTWSAMLMSNMNIPKVAQIQINGQYRGPQAMAQGIMKAMYGLNVGVKRDLWKNASLSLNVSDVFNTRQFSTETSSDTFFQTSTRKRESRIATLTFTYRFGKFLETDKRKQNKGGGEQRSEEDFF